MNTVVHMNNQTCPYIVGSNEGTHYCSLSESAIRERDKRIAELEAERDQLRAACEGAVDKYNALVKGQRLLCAFCDHAVVIEYSPDKPSSQKDLLTEHVMGCSAHPMQAVTAERDRLRAAIESAPHEARCKTSGQYLAYNDLMGGISFAWSNAEYDATDLCNCWKRAALDGHDATEP